MTLSGTGLAPAFPGYTQGGATGSTSPIWYRGTASVVVPVLNVPFGYASSESPGLYIALVSLDESTAPRAHQYGDVWLENEAGDDWDFAGTTQQADASVVLPTSVISRTAAPGVIDSASEIVVRPLSGHAPVSVTKAEVFTGKNRIYLNGEIIGVMTSTLQMDGTYKLTNLMRGQDNTSDSIASQFSSGHAVWLDGRLFEVPISPARAGQTVRVQATKTGGIARTSGAIAEFVWRRTSVTPPSVVDPTAVRTESSLTLGWSRRSKIPYSDLGDTEVPLPEYVEVYEVEISNPDGLIRQERVVGGRTYVYTEAQQQADGSAVGEELTISIYQVDPSTGKSPARTFTTS